MSEGTASNPAHDRFRELLSARLDGPLAADDDAALTEHLNNCRRCRLVEHDYLEQRHQLRALQDAIPPRDMWARTSAALDRELLRDARRTPRASGQRSNLTALATPGTVPSVLLISATSVAMATLLLVTQLGPSLRLPDGGTGAQGTAAPGGVALAFVGTDASGLTLYRTQVDEGCPNAAECPGEDAVEARVTFPASFEPSTLALAPHGDRLAIMGIDGQRDDVFAIMNVPPLGAAGSSDAPAGNTPDAATATAGDVPNRSHDRPPDASSLQSSNSPGSSVMVVVRTPEPSATVSSSGPPTISTELVLSTILDGVRGVGASPAWSSDGQALAFSAMPSDGTVGPDIYIWQVGDARARPITDDHRSYFASWSGTAVVINQTDQRTFDSLSAAPKISTVAINVQTREQRKVIGPDLWLPQVDPTGAHAVGWRGELTWDDRQVVPRHGGLYVVDWSALNPFGDGAPVVARTPDAVDMTGGNTTSAVTPQPAPAATDQPTPGGQATPDPDASAPRAPVVTDAPPAPAPDGRLTPLDPTRDLLQHPVIDWRVMWSDDGRLLAEWVSDENDVGWGRLRVLTISDAGPVTDPPLLPATPAKRGFTLGPNRIAWVAPTDQPTGELRLRVWGTAGVHDVHIKPLDSTGVVAAF